jgi:phage-related protein
VIPTADGNLNFDTKIDTSGFEKGEQSLKGKAAKLAAEYKKQGMNSSDAFKKAWSEIERTSKPAAQKTAKHWGDATSTIKSHADGLKSVMAGLGRTLIAALSITAVLSFGKSAIDVASDLQEVQNVVDTAFGDISYKIEEFADRAIEDFGLSELAAKQMASTYMAMSTGMGQMAGEASDMAVEITGRLGDVMSFYNKTQSEVDTIGKAIYTGETEPLKAIGVVATETNLSLFALQKGFKRAYSEMASDEKLLVRQMFFLDKTNLAAGDFVKTSGSWANQTRVLSERWKEFMVIIGNGLIQVLTPAIQFLNTSLSYLIEFATTAGRVLSSVFNLSDATGSTANNTAAIAVSAGAAASGLDDMSDATKKASKAAKGGLSNIDKLNNMTESIADNSTGAANALSNMGAGSGNYGATVKVDSDTSALETGLTGAMGNIRTLMTGFNTWITSNFTPIFTGIWAGLQAPIEIFKGIMAKVFTDIQSLGQPLIDFFSGPYTEYLKQAFISIGIIATGLFDTFNKVFSDIWNIAVFPMVQKFVTDILPMLAEFGAQVWGTLEVVFTEVKTIFDMIWSDAIAPALAIATQIWTDFVNIIVEFWGKWGQPVFDNIKLAFQTMSDLLQTLWKTTLKPIWDAFMKTVDKLWTKHLKPLLANFMDLVGEFVTGAMTIYNKFIAPVVKWFVEKFGPPISKVISGLITFIGDFLGGIVDAVSGIITALKGIVQFITGVFTGDWEKAWQGVQNIFKGIFDALVGIVKTPINLIIDLINGMINGITEGINTVITAANTLSYKVPDWVPKVGGQTWGFNFKPIVAPKIPKLATGTVIPANYGSFLAELGDNTREPEIVSPVSAMKQAFKEAMSEMGNKGSGEIHIYLEGDARGVFKLVKVEENNNYQATGEAVFVH